MGQFLIDKVSLLWYNLVNKDKKGSNDMANSIYQGKIIRQFSKFSKTLGLQLVTGGAYTPYLIVI